MLLALVKHPSIVLLCCGDIHAHLLLAGRAAGQWQRQCTATNSKGGASGRHEHQRARNCPPRQWQRGEAEKSNGREAEQSEVRDLTGNCRLGIWGWGILLFYKKKTPCKIGRIKTNYVAVNSWSNPPSTHRVRATMTIFSRHIVFNDHIKCIPKFSDRIMLPSQL